MAEIKVPDIGDFHDVEVIEVLAGAGDVIAKEQGLITLETDKASMDVPSSVAGELVELKVKVGDKVSEGDLIAVVAEAGAVPVEAAPAAEPTSTASAPAAPPPASEAPAQPAASATVEVKVPDIGDFHDVEVIEVLAGAGDVIAKEQGLITLETDKASMDVPSSVAGELVELKVKVGDKVSEGDLIGIVAAAQATPAKAAASAAAASAPPTPPASPAGAPAPPASPSPAAPATPAPQAPPGGAPSPTGKIHASPAVRKLAREFGVDLTQIKATGNKARVLKEDIQSYVKQRLAQGDSAGGIGLGLGYEIPAQSEPNYASFGPVEEVATSRIQQLSGPFLHSNWLAIPHVTQFADADVTELESFRKAHVDEAKQKGYGLSPLAFLVKAVTVALIHYPAFNASLRPDGKKIVRKGYFNIGIAVDTPGGLVVPNIRDCERKTVMEIAEDMSAISKQAREGKLSAKQMQGGTFTISSLGGIGGTHFTPIINAPEVAILGVGRSRQQPVWNGSEFRPRLMMPLALSYDHRVIDGANGARFITHLCELLGDIRNIVL